MKIEINENSNWRDQIKNQGSIALEGIMTINDIDAINMHYDVLDLSRVVFDLVTKKKPCVGIVCHGIAYSAPMPKEINPLLDIAKKVHAKKIILPADVTRKQMNAIVKNTDIHEVLVPEDCKLFSMKGGNVYNKKGDKIVFQKRQICHDE